MGPREPRQIIRKIRPSSFRQVADTVFFIQRVA
jgi:hypothetical protein